MYQRLLCGFLLVAMATWGMAQEGAGLWVGARAHGGFLWPHRPFMRGLVQGHVHGVTLFAEQQVRGDRDWHRVYRGPRYGASLFLGDLGNPVTIGRVAQLLPYVELPFGAHPHRGLGMRLGWGLGWVEKPFDRRDNPHQVAIGAGLNTGIHLALVWQLQAGRMRYGMGLGMDHWSNGAVREPNLGFNVVTAHLTLARALGDPLPRPAAADSLTRLGEAREFLVVAAIGADEKGLPGQGLRSAFSLSAIHQWRISRRSFFSAGVDVFNKGSLAVQHTELEDRSRPALTQFGAGGGYALGFGRADLFLHTGVYLISPVPDAAPIYNRIGLRYRSGEHLVWNISLKTHYAVADHWEFGIGYRW